MFNNSRKNKLIILTLILAGGLLFAGSIFAQNLGLGSIDTIAKVSGYKTDAQGMAFFNTTVASAINVFLGLIGVVFVGLAVYSGYQWMTAGGEEEKVKTSQTRLRNAAIGLAIVLLAFVGTKTVFTFFYQQAGNRSGSNLGSSSSCQSDRDCEFNYMCLNKICQPAENIGGKRCEHNSDCPADQPLCEQIGNVSDATDGAVNFQGWSYCTCNGDSDCLGNTKCVDISGPGSACRECVKDTDCGLGKKCNVGIYMCGSITAKDCSGLSENDCNRKTDCIWNGFSRLECAVNCSNYKTESDCNKVGKGVGGCSWAEVGVVTATGEVLMGCKFE